MRRFGCGVSRNSEPGVVEIEPHAVTEQFDYVSRASSRTLLDVSFRPSQQALRLVPGPPRRHARPVYTRSCVPDPKLLAHPGPRLRPRQPSQSNSHWKRGPAAYENCISRFGVVERRCAHVGFPNGGVPVHCGRRREIRNVVHIAPSGSARGLILARLDRPWEPRLRAQWDGWVPPPCGTFSGRGLSGTDPRAGIELDLHAKGEASDAPVLIAGKWVNCLDPILRLAN